MAEVRTYLLAPNFTFKASTGPIQLGNIIANPFKPTKILSSLDASQLPEVESVTEEEHRLGRETSSAVRGGVWTHFMQSVGGGLSGEASKDVVKRYAIDSLETRCFRNDPTEDEVAARLANPKVQAAVLAGLFGTQPVYMITGIKIANGFSMESEFARAREVGAETTLPVTDQVSAGGELHVLRRDALKDCFKGGGDIVFAYQLHVIKQKGRKDNVPLSIDVFESKAAFLGEEEPSTTDFEDMTASPATVDDLPKDSNVSVAETQDGNKKCICISFKDL